MAELDGFTETPVFTAWINEHLSDEMYFRGVQDVLLANPKAGSVMKGCGGLRKLRVGDRSRGKGKRGGARIIYAHFPEYGRFYMVAAYGKDEKDDITAADRSLYRMLVDQYRAELERERAARGVRTWQ